MRDDFLTLVIDTDDCKYSHSCEDEESNAEYLNQIGFPWEEAIEIAAWATYATEGREYEQDTLPGVSIYIV